METILVILGKLKPLESLVKLVRKKWDLRVYMVKAWCGGPKVAHAKSTQEYTIF
jgi:hypothetical protein